MKKISRKQRTQDVIDGISHRKGKKHGRNSKDSGCFENESWRAVNTWIDNQRNMDISIKNERNITLNLPRVMNFYDEYDSTILYITAIRKLSEKSHIPWKAYKLVSVNFDNLRKISTSAALVLTAELSKWDDTIRQRLKPIVDDWDNEILTQFYDLGFFYLFTDGFSHNTKSEEISDLKLVKYIKGKCGDNNKARILKSEINNILGKKIPKWTFLHSGLTEAITNVSHHAYPDKSGFSKKNKNWYLTGSYNEKTKELKIVFYDQGIGIPKSLPASDIWETVLKKCVQFGFSLADQKNDEVLLKAAVQLDRTSTGELDRGKGLQDLLEFIRQRRNGYLSILSLKGLFKFSMCDGKESTKSEHFDNPVCGTLIIWSATLND